MPRPPPHLGRAEPRAFRGWVKADLRVLDQLGMAGRAASSVHLDTGQHTGLQYARESGLHKGPHTVLRDNTETVHGKTQVYQRSQIHIKTQRPQRHTCKSDTSSGFQASDMYRYHPQA